MVDFAKALTISVTATVASYYIIRELQTDGWRTKHYYGQARNKFNKVFK